MRPLQKEIINALKVQQSIKPNVEIRRTIDFLKQYLVKHPFLQGYVLGISGGQDSTLAGALAQRAINELNEEHQTDRYAFYAVRLPYGAQVDESDAMDAIAFMQASEVVHVNIKGAVDASVQALQQAGVEISDFNKGNIKARERMIVQYALAAAKNCAVIGTDHAAEAVTGFYTKFGDGAADIMPLWRLTKRQGKALLQVLGAPVHLYEKVPTADLEEDRPSLPDEVALGVTYQAIDDYLEGHEVDVRDAETIEKWYVQSQHKRHLPITIFDQFWK